MAFALGFLGVFLPVAAHAQSNSPLYWDAAGGTGTWSSAATNWVNSDGSPASADPTTTNDAVFNYSGLAAANETVSLSSLQSVLGLYFTNTDTTLLESATTAESLTIGNGTSGDGINIASAAGAVTIGSTTAANSLPIIIADSQTWTNNSTATTGLTVVNGISDTTASTLTFAGTGSTTVSGVISNGPGLALIQAGAGILSLNASNSFAGLTIQAGTVNLGTVGAQGAGTITIGTTTTNATLNVAGIGSGANGTYTGAIAVGGSGIDTLSATAFNPVFSGPITLGNNLTIESNNSSGSTIGITGGILGTGNVTTTVLGANAASTITLSGSPINPTGSFINNGSGTSGVVVSASIGSNVTGLTQSGASPLTLTGNNTYIGPTTVSAGALTVSGGGTLSGTTALSVSGATFDYFPSAAGPLTLGSGSTLSLTNSTIGLGIGDSIVAAGAAAVSGTNRINLSGAITPGNSYTLLSAAGGLASGGTFAVIVSDPTNYTYTTSTGGGLSLSINTTAESQLSTAYWTGGLSGATNVWASSNGAASNWVITSGGSAQGQVPGSATSVTFSSSPIATAPTATVLGANMTINNLTIADTVNGLGLTGDGNTLTITPTSSSTGITMNTGVPASSIAANVALGAPQTWTNNSANLLTVSGVVSGGSGNGLTVAGSGSLTLSGANSYSGATTVNAGTLVLSGSAAAANNSAIAMANSANLTFSAATGTGYTFNQAITGTAGNVTFNVDGNTSASGGSDGTHFTLNDSGGFTGTIVINTGLVSPTADTVFGNAANVVEMNAPNGSSAGIVTTGNVTLPSTRSFDLTTAGGIGVFREYSGTTLIVNGVISGPGTLYKTDGGTLDLGGANTFTGPSSVGSGTMDLTNALALQDSTLTSGGTTFDSSVTANGNAFTLGGLTGSTNFALANNATTPAAVALSVGNDNASTTFSAALTGAGSLTKIGTGTFTLSGTGSYTGATNITGGELLLSGTGAINTSSGITINGTGASLIQASSVAISPAITLSAGTLGGAGTVGTVNVADAAGAILQGGNGSGGVLTIGSLNFAGSATINLPSGATLLATTLATPNAGTITINASGLNGGFAKLINYGSYNGANSSDFTVGAITLGPNQAVVSGVINNTGSSSIGVDVMGNIEGIVNFGAAKTISGVTDVLNVGKAVAAYDFANSTQTVNGVTFTGTTYAGSGTAPTGVTLSGVGTNNVNAFNSGTAPFGTLNSSYLNMLIGSDYGGSSAATVTLTSLTAGHVYATQFWVNDPRPESGRAEVLTSAGGNSVTLSYSANNVAGSPGQYSIGGFTASGASQAFTITPTSGGTPAQINAIQVRDVTGVWSGSTNGIWESSGVGSSNLNFTGNNNFSTVESILGASGSVYFGDTDGFGNAITNSAITVGTVGAPGVSAGSVNFLNNSVAYSLTNASGTTGITGTTAVTMGGSGTVRFNSANTYTGGTTISAGSLQFAQTAAMPASGTVAVASGGTLAVNAGGSGEFTNATSGAGSIGGLLGGIGGQGAPVTLASGAYLGIDTTDAGGSLTYSGNITNAGLGIVKLGSGTLTLSGTNTYSGGNIVNGGTLYIPVGGTLGATTGALAVNGASSILDLGTTSQTVGAVTIGGGTIQDGGTLTGTSFTSTGGTVNVSLAGVGAPLTLSSGTLTLNAANTYSGATAVNAGVLQLGNAGAVQNSTVTVTPNNGLIFLAGNDSPTLGGLAGAGNIALQDTAGSPAAVTLTVGGNNASTTYSGVLSGPGGLTRTGTGTLTLSGANTYTGATAVAGGTLSLSTGSLGNTAVSVGSGANSGALRINGSYAIGTASAANASLAIGGTTAGGTLSFSSSETSVSTLSIRNATATTPNLTLGGSTSGDAVLNFNYSATGTDQIVAAGQLTVNPGGAVINIAPLSGVSTLGAGPYTLLSYAAVSSAPTSIGLGNALLPSGDIGYLTTTTTSVSLSVVAGATGNAYWAGGTDGNWNTNPAGTTNWVTTAGGGTSSALPDSNTNVFETATTAGNLTQTLGQGFTVNSLTFNNPAGVSIAPGTFATDGITIMAGSANGNTAGSGLTVLSTAGANTISAPVILGAAQSWSNASSNPLTLSGGVVTGGYTLTIADTGTGGTTIGGSISGAGGLTMSGSDTLTLSGASTYSGTTTVTSGTFSLASTGSIASSAGGFALSGASTIANINGAYSTTGTTGTSAVTVSAGTLNVGSTGSLAIASSLDVTAGGNLVISGNVTMGSGSAFGIGSGIGSTTGTVTVAAGGTLNIGAGNGITFIGGDFLNTAGNGRNGTYGVGTLTINGGTVNVAAPGTGSNGPGGLDATSLWLDPYGDSSGPSTINLNGGTLISARPIYDGSNGNSVVNFNGGTFEPTYTAAAMFGGTINLEVQTGGAIVDVPTGLNVLISQGLVHGGGSPDGGLTVNGPGILTLTGGNSYTGPTTINSGSTLQLGNQSASGSLSGSSAIAVNGTFLVDPSTGGVTLSNTITGNGTITVNGSTASGPSYLSFTGNATGFTGAWLLEAGRLQTTAANINPANQITVTGNATVGGELYLGTTTTFANPITISGIGALEAVGNLGAIRLQGGSYAGPITLGGNARITAFASNGTLSGLISGAYVLSLGDQNTGTSAGTISITGADNTYSGGTVIFGANIGANAVGALGTGPITLSNATSDTAATALTESIADALTGTNSLTVQAGTATLSQTNDYTGGSTVSGGTLAANAVGALGTGNVLVSGGALTESIGSALNGASQALSVTSGTAALSQANSYAGGTTISGGLLDIGNASALGAGPFAINGGTIDNTSGAAMVLSATGGTSLGGNFTFTGTKNLDLGPTSITLSATPTITVAANTLTFSSPVVGTGFGLTKAGPGTLALTNAESYTGPTTVSGGTLSLAAGSLGDTAVAVGSGASGGTLRLNGNPATPYTIGSGSAVNASLTVGGATGIGTLTFSSSEASHSILSITNGNTSAANLTLGGSTSGAAVLNFNYDSSTTDEIVASGTLAVNPGGAVINLSPLASAELGVGTYPLFSYNTSPVPTAISLGSFTAEPGEAGYLTSTSTGVSLTIVSAATGNAYWAGSTDDNWNTINTGVTNWVDAASNGNNTGLPVGTTNVFETAAGAAQFSQSLGQSFTINSLNFNSLSGISIGPGVVTTNSITILAGTANGNTAGNGISVAAGAGANSISAAIVLGASQNWTNNSTNPLTVSGAISDGGNNYALTLSGQFTFSGPNSYGGGTVLDAGTLLNINADAALGAAPASPTTNLTFAGNSTLQAGGTVSMATNRNLSIGAGVTATIDTNGSNVTIPGVISGGDGVSNLAVVGSGTLTLSGANTYAGPTTVNAGTLQLGDGTARNGSVAGNIANNAALVFANPNSQTYSGIISGGGNVTKTGAGYLQLTGANTSTGSLTVNGGTLNLVQQSAFTGTTTISSGTLVLGSPALPSIAGLAYHLDASVAGTLRLNGTSVAGWNDLTANAVNFTQSASGSQPAYVASGINGLGSVSFNGSTSQLVANLAVTTQTVFIVDTPGATNTDLAGIFGSYNNDNGVRMYSPTAWQNGASGNSSDFTNGGSMYLDGVQQTGNANFSTLQPQLLEAVSSGANSLTAALGEYINTGTSGTRFFNGEIGEVLVFNGTLTAAQQAQVDAYLTAKWLTPDSSSVTSNVLPATNSVNLSGSGATLDLGTTNQTIASLTGVSGSGVNLESQTLTVNNSSPTTFAGVMSGAGSLVMNGSSTFTLTGANTYTGGTTISNGTLRLGDGTANNGSVAGNISNNATLTFANPNPQTYGGIISGNGAVNKTGAGALTLSGYNTNTGALTVNGGTVTLTNYQSYATTTIQSGTLLLGGAALPAIPGLSYHLDATNASNLTLSGGSVLGWADSSGNGVNFTGGTYTNSAGNAVTPPTYIAAGSAGAINGLGTVNFNGTTAALFANQSATTQTVFIVDQVNGYTGLGGIFGASADLGIRMNSSSTWQNVGTNGNDFTNGGSMYVNGALQSGNGTFTIGTPQILEGVSATASSLTAGLGGYFVLPGNGPRNFDGEIGEVLVYNGTLTTAEQQAVDTYLTDKWFSSALGVNPSNILPAASTVNITGSGATLDLGTANQTVGSLAGVAGSLVNLESQTLSIGGSSSTTFAGTMSGAGSLVVGGSGVLTLSAANTYSGGTTINSTGTLRVANGSSGSATGPGAVLVSNGGTLGVTVAGGSATVSPIGLNTVTIASGGNLAGANGVTLTLTNGLILQAGAIATANLSGMPNGNSGANPLLAVNGGAISTSAGSYTVNLTGSPTAGTYDLINYSGATLSGNGAFQIGSVPSGFGYELQLNPGISQLDLMVVGVLNWNGSVSNVWDVDATNNWTTGSPPAASPFLSSAPVVFGDGASNTSISIQPSSGVNPSSVTFTNTGASNGGSDYTISNAAGNTVGIYGSTGITLNGIGNVMLHGQNSFTGPVTLNAGQLILQANGAIDYSSSVIVASGAALNLQGASVGNIPSTNLSGAGLAAAPAGALVSSSGSNSYAGAITVDSMGATIGSTSTTAGDGLTIIGGIDTAGNALTFSGAGNTTVSSMPIIGTGSLTYNGTAGGTLSLAVASSYSGGTTISGGTLRVANSTGTSATGSGPVAVSSGGTLGGAGTVSGLVTVASGGIIAPGAGQSPIGITSNFNGGLTLQSGSQLTFNLSSSADATGNNLPVHNSSNDYIVSGNLDLAGSGTVNVNDYDSTLQIGTYELISYTSLTGSASGWTTGIVPAGYSYSLSTTLNPDQLDLIVGSSNGSSSWASSVSGDYETANNWNPKASPDGPDLSATFPTVAGANSPITVTVGSNDIAGELTFNSSSTSYMLKSGTLTLDNGGGSNGIGGSGAIVNVSGGANPQIYSTLSLADSSHTTTFNIDGTTNSSLTVYGSINDSNTVPGQSIVLTGGGTLSLEAPNGYTGNTTVNGGTLNVGDQSPSNLGSGTLTINASGGGASVVNLTGSTAGDGGFVIGNLSGMVSGAGSTAQLNVGSGYLSVTESPTAPSNTYGGTLYLGTSTGLIVNASGTTLTLSGAPTFAGGGNTVTVNSGTLAFANATAATVEGPVSATVAAGATLQLAGTAPALSQGAYAATILTQQGTGGTADGQLLVTGTAQTVGVVSGTQVSTSPTTYAGTTTVGDGTHAASLSAAQILQNTLAINAGSTVTILPFAGGQDGAQPAAITASATPAAATAGALPAATPSDPFTAIQAAITSGAISGATGQSLENRITAIESLATADPGLNASLLESRVLAVLPSNSALSTPEASPAEIGSSLLASDTTAFSSPSASVIGESAIVSAAFAPSATFAASPAAVPEPSTLLLAALAGCGAMFGVRRRAFARFRK